MIIRLQATTDFWDAIEQMVKRGLTFEASFAELSITLTGGF